MNRKEWGAVACDNVVKLRAGGRKRYNAYRQLLASIRQQLLVDLLYTGEIDTLQWGWQTRAAEKLGVNRSTICRDHQKIRQIWLERRRKGHIERPTETELDEYNRTLQRYKEFWQEQHLATCEDNVEAPLRSKECDTKQLESHEENGVQEHATAMETLIELARRFSSTAKVIDPLEQEAESLTPRWV